MPPPPLAAVGGAFGQSAAQSEWLGMGASIVRLLDPAAAGGGGGGGGWLGGSEDAAAAQEEASLVAAEEALGVTLDDVLGLSQPASPPPPGGGGRGALFARAASPRFSPADGNDPGRSAAGRLGEGLAAGWGQ